MAVAVRPLAHAAAESPNAGELFAAHSDRLLAYCVSLLGSRAEAEDALQTTFLYAHRALERGVVPENEYAWLHAIAKNACRWHLRTLARRGSLSSDLDLDAFPSRSLPEADARDLRDELECALATIPETQRHAFVLREVHGLAAHEVAARLGMTPKATYALLTRARRSLAQAISASRRAPLFGLDLGTLAYKLKALFAGGTAKVVATAAAAGSIAIGGVAVERAVDGPAPAARPAPAVPSAGDTRETRAAGSAAGHVSSPGAGRDARPTLQEGSAGAASVARPSPPAGTSEPPTVPAAVPPELQPAADSVPTTTPTPADAPEPAEAGEPKPVTELAPELPAPEEEEEVPPLVEDLLDPLVEDLPELPLPDLEEPLASTDDLLDPVLDGGSDLDDVVDDTLSDVDDTVSDLPLPDVELPLP
jgi:RNA polymerase sigma-70 factor (ECF subfamily)